MREDDDFKSIFSSYSHSNEENALYQQEHEAKLAEKWTETYLDDEKTRQFGNWTGSMIPQAMNMLYSGASSEDIAKTVKSQMEDAGAFGRTSEDVADVYLGYIKTAISSGTEDEKLLAIDLYNSLENQDMRGASEEYTKLGATVRAVQEQSYQDAMERENRLFHSEVMTQVDGGNVQAVYDLIENEMPDGYYTENKIQTLLYSARKNAGKAREARSNVHAFMGGKLTIDAPTVKGEKLKELDASIADEYFQMDEQGVYHANPTTMTQLVKQLAVNRDVNLPVTVNRLVGGLDYEDSLDKDGNFHPRYLNAIHNVAYMQNTIGSAATEQIIGSQRYESLMIARAMTGDNLSDTEGLKSAITFKRKAETFTAQNGKPSVDSTALNRMASTISDSTELSKKEAKDYLTNNERTVQLFLAGTGRDEEQAGKLLSGVIGDTFYEYGGNQILNASVVTDQIKTRFHYDVDEVLDTVFEPYAEQAGIDVDDLELSVNPDNKAVWYVQTPDMLFATEVNVLDKLDNMSTNKHWQTAEQKHEDDLQQAESDAMSERAGRQVGAERVEKQTLGLTSLGGNGY